MARQVLGGQRLPVVLYSTGISFPGASHALAPAWEGRRTARRLPLGLLLILCGVVLALGLHLALAPPIASRLAPSKSRPTSLFLRPMAKLPEPALPWDSHLAARPPKGQFVRFFRMMVTAYTPINTRMEGGRYTATLRDGRAAHGVAVDPSLIPLGSHLWIPGYGHAIADDIGGRIQGHHIDLRVQVYQHMGRWGVRHARVYVLRDP